MSVLFASLAGALAILAARFHDRLEDEWVLWLGAIVFGPIGVVAGLQIVLGAIIVVLNLLRFGWGNPLNNVLVRVSTEATPVGRSTLELFRSEGGTLAHSEAYQNPDIIEQISGWIRQVR